MLTTSRIGPDLQGSWTRAIQTTLQHETIPGTLYPVSGIALLFYKPERRLSVSLWTRTWSKNIRLWGPKKLSWEK